jgi:FAD/FMN-containing dehydrogenase
MNLDRRQFLRQALSGAAVLAFVPSNRSWATLAGVPGAVPVPPLDGELILEGEALDQAAADFGRLISRPPYAVLRPGSVEDVVKMVNFAREQSLHIAGMGRVGDSHSTFGQAQVEAGIVIDMASFHTIHEVGEDSVLVDAGVSWLEVLEATLPAGLSPPTLTDYIGLRVGATLSAGGIGGQAFRHGLQLDNVLEMEVVTGKGERLTCSRRENPVLFHSVRGGLGQFAVIVRARLRLVAVPPETRTYLALYSDLATFTADQERLIRDGRFDYVEGQAVPGDGGWLYLLEAVKYFDPAGPPGPPDDQALTGDLSFLPGTLTTEDRSYFDFANRLAPLIAFLQQIGVWDLPHPWIDIFVPARQAVSFIGSVLAEETPDTLGQGPILIYPNRRSKVTAPFLQLPQDPVFYLFSILRTTLPPTDPQDQLARNREIYDQMVAGGGKRYAISSVELTPTDWREHFGPDFPRFEVAKAFFDPDRVLTPGHGIFSA